MLYLTFVGVTNLKSCKICTSVLCDCHQNNNIHIFSLPGIVATQVYTYVSDIIYWTCSQTSLLLVSCFF